MDMSKTEDEGKFKWDNWTKQTFKENLVKSNDSPMNSNIGMLNIEKNVSEYMNVEFES